MADQRLPIAQASLELLHQASELLLQIDAALYCGEPAAGSGTVGQHFRHVLDFYGRFLAGLDDGDVRYDARERESRIELEPDAARQKAIELAGRLERLTADAEDGALAVAHTRDDDCPRCASSVGRELLFLASHTTHHFALIAVLLRLQGLEPGAEFGVATSTLDHRRQRPVAVRA